MKIFLLYFGLISVCWSLTLAVSVPVENSKRDTKTYRLNQPVQVVHYDIEIEPYLDDTRPDGKTLFTFGGITNIQFIPLADINSLHLNWKLLNLTTVRISKFGEPLNDSSIPKIIQYDTESIALTFIEPLAKSVHYELKFVYTGQMDTDMHGFYRSSYIQNDKVEWLGATQLQPTHARRVFPCFDEPYYKATFKLTLNIPKAYKALSNTEPETVEVGERQTKYIFYKTPTMSTYLLGFIVSKFVVRSDTSPSNHNFKLAIYSRPDQYNLTEYSLKFGLESLSRLDKYLGIKFENMDAMTKMDMIAIPDFASGAMENWGLLTYKELFLLYDAEFSTDLDKREIALTIAHEQAHQWFGNLVTCDWWSSTWLNEGLATYFEFFITADIEPQWELEKTFITDTVHRALLFDSQDNTHALFNPEISSPGEISEMFSLVSYQKGGSIIRMIEHFIGPLNFMNGLRSYLKEYSYGSSKPEYLLKHFQGDEILNGNITETFMSWITQPGYPVVTVTIDQNRKIATLTQKRFLLNRKPDSSKWSIPITYTTEIFDNLKPIHVFSSTSNSYTITIDAPTWIIFNVQQSGFYRVQYDNISWQKIGIALKQDNHDGIHEVNRAQIVDDLLNFGRSNDLDYDFIMEIMLYLKQEIHFLPWHAAFTGFEVLLNRMSSEQQDLFRSFVLELTQNAHNVFGFQKQQNDTQLEIHLRSKLIEWSCKSGQMECIVTSTKLFQNYLDIELNRIPVDIRGAVICSALRHTNITVYDIIWSRYKKEQVASEQIILLKAMGCQMKDALVKHLDNIFSYDVRMQDKRIAFQATYTQYNENIQTVFDYLIEHHLAVVNALGSKAGFIGYLTGLADRLTLRSQINQLKKFQVDTETNYEDFKSSIQSAIDKANTNQEWSARYIPVITKFIEDKNGVVRSTISLWVILVAVVNSIL